MVVLDLDRVAERPALGLRWPRPCIIIGGAAAAALKGSRDITLVKLYRRTAAAATKALVATILFLFVFKALFYTHGRLLLLESFSIERSGSCLFGYYVLLLAYNALWCQPSWLNRRRRQRRLTSLLPWYASHCRQFYIPCFYTSIYYTVLAFICQPTYISTFIADYIYTNWKLASQMDERQSAESSVLEDRGKSKGSQRYHFLESTTVALNPQWDSKSWLKSHSSLRCHKTFIRVAILVMMLALFKTSTYL